MSKLQMSERQTQALERVRRAGVIAADATVLAWIRSVGPDAILSAGLRDILGVCGGFLAVFAHP
jgi:hypothetical protein